MARARRGRRRAAARRRGRGAGEALARRWRGRAARRWQVGSGRVQAAGSQKAAAGLTTAQAVGSSEAARHLDRVRRRLRGPTASQGHLNSPTRPKNVRNVGGRRGRWASGFSVSPRRRRREGARRGGGARPDLTLCCSKSPSSFFSCVIKSRVSGVGARFGRGSRRGGSRCEARTSGALDARCQRRPPPQLMPRMPWA